MCSLLKASIPLAAALIVLSAGAASAQDHLNVKVPFPFEVRGKVLPAGQYSVEQEGAVLIIRGEHGTHGNAAVITIPAGGQDPSGDTPVLTFVRHENDYRLASVWESKDRGEMVEVR
ncbi:MAG: hypothetical protein M3P13_11835 [Acidobacteriota bacterium]|nr:hypothetical protein [Acidobacteriota bacterium]